MGGGACGSAPLIGKAIVTTPLTDQRITQICELGCTRVTEIITLLEQGQATPETNDLPENERLQVLDELKAIMAVYSLRKDGCR